MKFADKYFKRYNNISPLFTTPPNKDINIVIVIPCFDEENILKTLYSLKKCDKTEKTVEIIVIINSGEKTDKKLQIKISKAIMKLKLI